MFDFFPYPTGTRMFTPIIIYEPFFMLCFSFNRRIFYGHCFVSFRPNFVSFRFISPNPDRIRSIDSFFIHTGKDHRIMLTLDLCLHHVYLAYLVFHVLKLPSISMSLLNLLLRRCPRKPMVLTPKFPALSILSGCHSLNDYLCKINASSDLPIFIFYYLL